LYEAQGRVPDEGGILFYVFCPLIVKLFDTFFV